MAKYRYVYTAFWEDPEVLEQFTPEDKLFYLYLLTNPKTTQIGVYQITKKEMAFGLGYSMESVNSLLNRFTEHHKIVKYDDATRELALINWGKYNFNKGGKPIEDCVKKELKEVKDLKLIKYVSEKITNKKIRQIYENFIKDGEVYFEPSKKSLPKSSDKLTISDYILFRDKQTCFYTGEVLQLKDIEISYLDDNDGMNEAANLIVTSKKLSQLKSLYDLETFCNIENFNYNEIMSKMYSLKQFESERNLNKITINEAIENNIYDLNTLRNYLNTIRKIEIHKDDENIDDFNSKSCEVSKIEGSYDTSTNCTQKEKQKENKKEKENNTSKESINLEDSNEQKEEKVDDDVFVKILSYYKTKSCITIEKPADTEFAIQLQEEKIPLDIIESGIDVAFNSFKSKYEGDKIRSLRYCEGYIRTLWLNEQVKSSASTEEINAVKCMIKRKGECSETEINQVISSLYVNSKAEDKIQYLQEKLRAVDNYSKGKEINYIGTLIAAIKGDWKSQTYSKGSGYFNSFPQRNYDFDDLERKLLGYGD